MFPLQVTLFRNKITKVTNGKDQVYIILTYCNFGDNEQFTYEQYSITLYLLEFKS